VEATLVGCKQEVVGFEDILTLSVPNAYIKVSRKNDAVSKVNLPVLM
jgi:hypothetical protein